MSNLDIQPGELAVEELFAGVDDGIYACGTAGGATEGDTFVFNAAHGYRIENGQRGGFIRDITLTGNIFHTLDSIDGIANDFVRRQGPGGCGKIGQMGLPVTQGSPHLRIRDMLAAGE